MKNEMNAMDRLEELAVRMAGSGACVRAVPASVRSVVEARHAGDPVYGGPDIISKEIRFLEKYGRDMLVVERRPPHAGEFLLETGAGTSASVRFSGGTYYKSLTDVLDALKEPR